MLEKTLGSPLDCKEIKSINTKGSQPRILIGRTDAEDPTIWPADVKSWLIGKDPDAGKDQGQEEKGNDRGWNGWIASPTQWTLVWASSGSWWWTGKPGVLQSTGSQSWTRRSEWTTTILDMEWILHAVSGVLLRERRLRFEIERPGGMRTMWRLRFKLGSYKPGNT